VRRYQYVTDAFSTRNPTVVYTVLRDEAGLLECNCPAWTFSTKIVATAYGPQRVCNHVLRAIAGALPGAGPFRPAAEVAHGPSPTARRRGRAASVRRAAAPAGCCAGRTWT
jgi:hypothetical protein